MWGQVSPFCFSYVPWLIMICETSDLSFSSMMVIKYDSRKAYIKANIKSKVKLVTITNLIILVLATVFTWINQRNLTIEDFLIVAYTTLILWLGSMQFSLLGILFRLGNNKWMALLGPLGAYVCCILEIQTLRKLIYLHLPFKIYLFFGWSILHRGILGIVMSSIWIIAEMVLISYTVNRKDFIR